MSPFGASASGSMTGHYLNPVVPQNYTNRGTLGDFSTNYQRDLTPKDRLSLSIRHELSRYELPNDYCLRGSSAIEEILKQNQPAAVRVLVVWEPMLPTDWSRPSGMVQARISDPRVVQFWDKDHLVAKELRQQLPAQVCCQRNGVIWDFAAVYPNNAHWGSAPGYFGGAVLDVVGNVRQYLSSVNASP